MKNTPFSRLLIFVFVVLFFGVVVTTVQRGQAAGTTSRIVEVDDDGNVGVGTSVAVNSLNQEVIAYHDFTNSSLKIAVCDTESCSNPEIETVDNDGYVGDQPSLVINSQDRPVVSHYDRTEGDLRLTVCNDPFCLSANTTVIDEIDNVGVNSSIVLDELGRPIISYFDVTNSALKIAYCNNLACATPTLKTIDASGGSGFFSSLKLDENGLAVVSYYDFINTSLRIAFCNNAVCSAPIVKELDNLGDAGQYPSLAIVSGRIFVSYFRVNGTGKDLKLIQCNDASCDSAVVLDLVEIEGALFSSMIMNDMGEAFISFWDEGAGDLIVAACKVDPVTGCKGATFTRVDRFHETGLHTDITLDLDGVPTISYYDQEEEALNLASCPLCRVPTRKNIGPAAAVDAISVVVTEVGYPIVTYQDAGDNNFYLGYCQDTICNNVKKTSLGTNLHLNPSMQLQDNGRPAVVYYHASTNELKYTACNDALCSNRTTNVIAFDGYDPSLRFNSLGLPVISYYDAGGDDLVLARCNDIDCSAPLYSIIDDQDSVGSHTSMVLTPEDYPIISYYDQTNDTIKYAICDDVGCTNPAIAHSQATDGPYNSVGLSESGRVYIAFYNSSGPFLNILECNLPCESSGIGVLDNTATDVGWDISLVIGQDDRPLITYYDVESGVLRMATCMQYSCSLGATLGVVDTFAGDNGRFSALALNGRGEPVIAHTNLSQPAARVLVYDSEPILYKVYVPVVMKK